MKSIFEKDDYEKFMIFSYMEGVKNQNVSISDIEKRLSITYFKATKLMEELIKDFDHLELESFFFIEKKKRAYIYSKNGLDSVNRLFWIYGRQSFKLAFIDYFLKYKKNSIEDFSLDYFISLSKAYKISKHVNEFLDSYNLNFFESDQYSETQLRLFLTDIYTTIYKAYEEPFDKALIDKTEKLIDDLKNNRLVEIVTDLDYIKLKFYLYITYLRNQNNHSHFNEAASFRQIKFEQIKTIKSCLASFLVNLDNIDDEVYVFINFLQVNEFFLDGFMFVPIPIRAALDDLFTIICSYKELHNYRSQIRESFIPLFTKVLYYDTRILDSQFNADLSVFQENYSEIYQLCLDICLNKKVIEILGIQNKNKSFLMAMMLKFIDVIPNKLLLKPIKVTVDFSIGKEYNTFISSIIDNLPFANVLVDNRYSEETDIYLSDFLTNQIKSKYIIWNNPPTSKDWEIFGNLVSVVKKQK
ncbi:hypothetical protein BFC22_04245 [Carnobacterium divergens]|uniref:helix-turn-helix domain-containing protein n=1 Tax=Carnobacterium divergens TaxID=2748 RepID=UPI000E72F995|nr:helix-turn-helix domain-containing protein [Carnobacterium divergens]ANZ99360.1 hypothetical protein BFC22_04245 [Carnobacterium divergens]